MTVPLPSRRAVIPSRIRVGLVLAGVAAFAAWAIRTTRFRSHQINDLITARRVADQVESIRSQRGALPPSDELLRSLAPRDLRDAWGNSIVVTVFESGGRKHCVVAALGRDAQPDGPWTEWLARGGEGIESIKGQWDRDTVIIDGRPLATGGK